jgi:hypothetical protein
MRSEGCPEPDASEGWQSFLNTDKKKKEKHSVASLEPALVHGVNGHNWNPQLEPTFGRPNPNQE